MKGCDSHPQTEKSALWQVKLTSIESIDCDVRVICVECLHLSDNKSPAQKANTCYISTRSHDWTSWDMYTAHVTTIFHSVMQNESYWPSEGCKGNSSLTHFVSDTNGCLPEVNIFVVKEQLLFSFLVCLPWGAREVKRVVINSHPRYKQSLIWYKYVSVTVEDLGKLM